MQPKPPRFAPTDARRPDLSAQACGVVAVVDQINTDLGMLGVSFDAWVVFDRVVSEIETAGEGRELPNIVLTATSQLMSEWRAEQRRRHLNDLSTYLPELGHLEELDARIESEALRRAGVPRSRLKSTQNPVGVAVRGWHQVEATWQKFQRLDRGRWWRILVETGSDGPFKTWPERWAATLGAERAEALCWALTRLESLNHLGLVWKIAHRMAPSYPDHTPHDMFGWGWHGLCQAIRGYDPSAAAFSTYAARRINGAIRDGIRSEHHLPKRLTSVVREIAGAEEELVHDLGRTPSLEELAAHVGATLAELEVARSRYQTPASIEELLDGGGEDSENDSVELAFQWGQSGIDDPEEAAVAAIQAEAVAKAIEALPQEEREAIRLLVFEEVSTTEAASMTGLTSRQLRRARDRGLASISEALKAWAA